MNITRDKALGMLLGLHAGDSLGATLEFQGPRDPSNWHRNIEGGGSFGWSPGAATDDTDLMIALLESLVDRNGFDPSDVIDRFVDWAESGPIDIGLTTRLAIRNRRRGMGPIDCGLTDSDAQGAGSLMRCAPLALLDLSEPELTTAIQHQARLTHAHPVCINADLILVHALKGLLGGKSRESVYQHACRRACTENHSTLQAARGPWKALETTGWVCHVLGAGFWGLMNADCFEDALVQVVNRGGDADTTGAVAGALCGAYFGVGAIPVHWLQVLERGSYIRRTLREIVYIEY